MAPHNVKDRVAPHEAKEEMALRQEKHRKERQWPLYYVKDRIAPIRKNAEWPPIRENTEQPPIRENTV